MPVVAAWKDTDEQHAGLEPQEVTSLPVTLRRSARVAGHVLQLYSWVVGRSASCRWIDARGRALGNQGLLRAFESGGEAGPVIVVYWTRDTMAVATLPYAAPVFRHVVERVRMVLDDTIGGRASAVYFHNLGGQCRLLALPGSHDRLRQLAQIMRERMSCAFAVDGGGPYQHVGTGVIGLAAALGAHIVPVVIRATPAIVTAPRSRVRIPVPFCRIVGVVGDGLAFGHQSDRRLAAEQLRIALIGLDGVARAASHDG